MKSYGEFCALSRALDVIGDRWTMLVVRELLIAPSRYSDLHKALPGIATNLLAQRLRTLEEAGVITSVEQPAPVSAQVYTLTDWGRGLHTVLVDLARWGVPLLAPGIGDDHSQGRWLAFAIMALYPERAEFPSLTVRIIADGDELLLTAGAGGVQTTLTSPGRPADITIEGRSDDVFRTLSGELTDQPTALPIGDDAALQRFSQLTRLAYTHDLDVSALGPRAHTAGTSPAHTAAPVSVQPSGTTRRRT